MSDKDDKSKLLLPGETSLAFQPRIVKLVEINGAIVLQQVHYWLEVNKEKGQNYRDGHYWVYNSFTKWGKQFPFWSIRTIKRTFAELEKSGLLLTGNYNERSYDRTKWYRIDYDELHRRIAALDETTQGGDE